MAAGTGPISDAARRRAARLRWPARHRDEGGTAPARAPRLGARSSLRAAVCLRWPHPASTLRLPARPCSARPQDSWRAGLAHGMEAVAGIPGRQSRLGVNSRLPLVCPNCRTPCHGVLASLRSSIPPFGLPPREEQPGSSLGGLGRGWACRHGPARGVRLDNRARKPGQGAHGRMAT
jgi:hypothetical protein